MHIPVLRVHLESTVVPVVLLNLSNRYSHHVILHYLPLPVVGTGTTGNLRYIRYKVIIHNPHAAVLVAMRHIQK